MLLRCCALVLSAVLLPAAVIAQDETSADPGELVEQATQTIMTIVNEAPTYFDEDPDRYYRAVGTELDKVVDFKSFARGVMGRFGTAAHYRSLDEQGQKRLREQLDRFASVVRDGLVTTYSKGLLAFGGSNVALGGVEYADNNARLASVLQKVSAEGGRVYEVRYQMGLYKDGQWRLRNMIIENVNLGEVYRSQFESAADKADGDLDVVIASWNAAALDDQTFDDGDDNGSN